MKKAILAVSFGTTHRDTLDKTIAAIERDLAAAFPDRDLFRAFTSGMVIRRLWERDGLEVESVPQALERLLASGYEDVVLQSAHVMNGDERDKMVEQAGLYADRFRRLAIGAPLLTETEDYLAVARALLHRLPPRREDTALAVSYTHLDVYKRQAGHLLQGRQYHGFDDRLSKRPLPLSGPLGGKTG